MIKQLDIMLAQMPNNVDKETSSITMTEFEYRKLCYQLKRTVRTYKGYKVKVI
jgi:hypothetical protein